MSALSRQPVSAVVVEGRPQLQADGRHEGVNASPEAAAGDGFFDAGRELAHECLAGVGVEAEQRRFAQHDATQQIAE